MSKLPTEARPIRLAPEIARMVEARLQPLQGRQLEAAQKAVLQVYRSGLQMPQEGWVREYAQAIEKAAAKSPP